MRLQKSRWTSRRPHKHVYNSLRCNLGARLVRLCARPSLPHASPKLSRLLLSLFGWTHGPHPAWSHDQRGPTTWNSETTCETRLAAGAWSLTLSSRMAASGAVATLSRTGCSPSAGPKCAFAAKRKINNYNSTLTNKTLLFSPPLLFCTSTRGEFLRLLFLQAHRETEAHFNTTGMPSQQNISDSFRLCRAAFYQSLKNKSVGVEDQFQY